MQSVPDQNLMQRYAQGDAAAFDELFARYHDRVFAFFLRRTRSKDRAADLYQELFLRLHRARREYDPSRPFAPWLFQIARNLLFDALRRSGRAQEIPLGDESMYAEDHELGPEDRLAASERAGEVLVRLSDVERYVLVGAKVHGREYSELARELGKSVVAVKKLASRAMQRLRVDRRGARELPALP